MENVKAFVASAFLLAGSETFQFPGGWKAA